LGLDARESTPGFKRQVVLLNAETRSLERTALVLKRVVGLSVSTNTIERICWEVGHDLEAAAQENWTEVLTGEVVVPEVAIVSYDGGRIRTRRTDCGPGVHLCGKGWNETKNVIIVSATSTTSPTDPEPHPPECFFDPEHVAQLTETAKTKKNRDADDVLPEAKATTLPDETKKPWPKHKPKRVLRTVLSSLKTSQEFGTQMAREAQRRRFGEASRKAFVGDGLTCNWTIQKTHFRDYVPILDFVHAVSYLYGAAVLCFGKCDAAWSAYTGWMKSVWQGNVAEVLQQLQAHQQRIGAPPDDASDDDPRERLRCMIQYLENNRERMRYDQYRCQGLPTSSAWMESAVKEMNYRVKGTEMFWNNPEGAEAILQIRAAALSDDDRLERFLTHRPGSDTVRKSTETERQAA
jgi:hypothetical protein